MQLAGYVQVQALQEWDLLEDHDKTSWEEALKMLYSRLNPGHKVLSAQNFRHTTQRKTESVTDFIRSLKWTFQIAYGQDGLTQEMRKPFCMARYRMVFVLTLCRIPLCPDRALTYRELRMAARNKEKRQVEMKK